MEKGKQRVTFFVSNKRALPWVAAALMLLSFALRAAYFYPKLGALDAYTAVVHLALPLACCLLYPVLLLGLGARRLALTAIPVLLGCAFFALKALSFASPLHTALCLLLYAGVAGFYALTVTGIVRTTVFLKLIFSLPFLYHVFVEDLRVLKTAQPPRTAHEWLPELSVLCIMAALFFASLAMEEKGMEPKGRRRLGDRSDGRLLRTLSPIFTVSPYIMKTRAGSQNFIMDKIEVTEIERYIHEKRAAGLSGFGILHVLVAAYVRAVSQKPAINRFISGQKIYARNNIEIVMTVKKTMSPDAPDTVLKMVFDPAATAEDVYRAFTARIGEGKEETETGFDSTAKIINYIPGLLKRFTVGLLNFLDYFGLVPHALLAVSPFHGSMYVTSMGSLGIPPIFHHLYDFGNVPVFCAFGLKRKEYELQRDGSVLERRYVDYTFVTDERICDGFYFAGALKYIRSLLREPRLLDAPPETVVSDVG